MFHKISRIDITFNLIIFFNICVSVVYLTNPQNQSESRNGTTGNKTSKTEFNFRYDDEESRRSHYALDPSDTIRLALTEEHLVVALSDIQSNELTSRKDDLCLRYLQKYLRDFNQDYRAVQGKRGIYRAKTVADNPNLTLRMIRRIVTTLLEYTLNSCKYSVPDVESIINDTFTALDLAPPKPVDLEDALAGLLRIHFVYGFNATTEISLGIFNGVKTEAQLYFEDCLALGTKAIQFEAVTLAYQWLTSASVRLTEIRKSNERLRKETRDLENAWLELQTLAKVDNLTALHALKHDREQKSIGASFNYEDYATCRGEIDQTIEYQSMLRCFYQFNWDPYFYINPVKTQVLCANPLIYQFYHFIGDSTLDKIRKPVRKNMTRSGTVSHTKKEAEFSPVRTSMNAFYLDRHNPKIVKLYQRIEKLTGLTAYKERASAPLQVVRYGSLGGHYDFHLDSLQGSTFNIDLEGDRIATLLIFLSDVKMGGYTAFPVAGTFAKPEKGSAILWYNTMLNGNPDFRARHGGCPVILGTKEITNLWIHQYENMFKEPCTLQPEQ